MNYGITPLDHKVEEQMAELRQYCQRKHLPMELRKKIMVWYACAPLEINHDMDIYVTRDALYILVDL